jgi:hypothetical protein
MSSRLARCAGATILAVLLAGPGDAAPVIAEPAPGVTSAPPVVAARKSKRSTRKSKKKRRSRARRNNMPKGWSWPPTPAMKKVGLACLDELDTLGVAWKKAPAARKVTTPITLTAMELAGVRLVSTYRKGPFVMDCHLALGLARFAPTLYEAGIRELHFSRIHDYTQVRVNGDVLRALSRHALGIAIDIRAFVDDSGRKAVVIDDYPRGDEMLLSVERQLNEAGTFRTVLTPSNDPASHDDHFHVEVGVDYTKAPPRGDQASTR